MRKPDVKQLTLAGLVAALYAVLSYFGNIFGLTFGPVQFRFSEALCVLPFLFPATAPGLFIGCLIANLFSPMGLVDVVFGSLATLVAALLTARMPGKWLAPLPPVVVNGLVIGAVIAWYEVGFTAAFPAVFAVSGLLVALGELGACYVLGLLLLQTLPRIKFFQPMLARARR